ncbi:hypothetical protein Tco_1000402 [Tanacetum coccineum]
MGEISYFLGLQIKQDDKEISICQEKYTRDLLKIYEISNSSLVKTPMVPPNNLGPDLAGKPANPKESHLIAVKRILGYLKGTPSFSLWYPKCSRLNIKGYSDSDYVGCNMDKKAPQVLVKYLEVNWSIGVQRNSTLGRHLEEIHMTWALFQKKWDKSTTLHKRRLEELHIEGGDGVRNTCDAV